MENVWIVTIVTFVTQVVFIWGRTWNVRVISEKKLTQAVVSGLVVHIFWIVTTALGVKSASDIILNGDWTYAPVIVASSLGGVVGTIIAFKQNKVKI